MTMATGFLIISLVVMAFATIIMVVRHCEKKDFNNGICKHCNGKLELFSTDSQGGRGYVCECGHQVWVSYNVDNPKKI